MSSGNNADAVDSAHPIRTSPAVGFRQELDLPDTLLQFVECGEAAPEQGMAIARGLDAVRATFQKPHADGVLETGDYFRYGRLRHPKLGRGFRHAAALHDRDENMQITQLQAAADLAFPVDFSSHGQALFPMRRNEHGFKEIRRRNPSQMGVAFQLLRAVE